MKRVVITVIVVLAIIAFIMVFGYLGYKHFILNNIRDGGGGMENPNIIHVENRPAEGAKLVYCSLTSSGTMAEENYSYTLEEVNGEVLLYTSYVAEDGERVEIEGQIVDPETLRVLNTMVLAFDLTETQTRADISEPFLFDGSHKTYALRWDDGTTAKPDAGFQKVNDYFAALLLKEAGSTSYSDGTPIMEIQLTVPTAPRIGAAPTADVSVSENVTVQEAYWWRDDNGGKPTAMSDKAFTADGNYSLRIVLRPANGYYVPLVATGDTEIPCVYQGELSVNGESVSIVPVSADGTLQVDWWGKPATNGN